MGMVVAPYRFGTYSGPPTFFAESTTSATQLPSSFTVAWPAGLASNDIALLYVSTNNAAGAHTIATPTGFTQIATTILNGGLGNRVSLFWMRLTGSESGSVSIVPSAGSVSTSSDHFANLALYRGCKTSGDPYESYTLSGFSGSGWGSCGVPLREILGPDRLLVHFYSVTNFADVVDGPTITAASGYTRRIHANPGQGCRRAITTKTRTTPGYDAEHVTFDILEDTSWVSHCLSLVPQTAISSTTPAYTDPHIASVVALLSFDGADAASQAVDEKSPNRLSTRVTGTTAAETDTAQSKFGGASLKVNNSSVTFPDSADWALGSGNFTVECWVRFNAAPSSSFHHLLGQMDTSVAGGRSFALSVASNVLTFFRSSDGTNLATSVTGAWVPSTGVWYHVAADFDGTTTRVYVDGAVMGSSATNVTLFDSTAALGIGAILASGANNGAFNGWLDEVRITKGVARYAGAFTAPTAAFPRN